MAGDDEKDAPAFLVGAGARAQEVGAVLAALARLAAPAAPRPEPLGDLEALLAQRPFVGLVILEAARVPAEDIGFVRRFLERQPASRMVVVGDDAAEGRARALLALPRSQWLPWPPDLEQLRSLLPAAGRATSPAPARAARLAPAEARRAPATNGAVEVGALLEELLARAVLAEGGGARYQFHASPPALVARERQALVDGLGSLVELARACAGGDGLVRAGVEALGDSVRIGLEFPRGPLAEKDFPAFLARGSGPEGLAPGLASALAQARSGAELLEASGGEVQLSGTGEGRVRCQVVLSTRPAPPRPARGKPEDPFA